MLEDFLSPAVLRSNLIVASIYIDAFDVLKSTIVERIRSFYTVSFDKKSGSRTDAKYESEVLSRNPCPVYASLAWLKESHAIDDTDIAIFERVKKCRNDIAHEIPRMLIDGLPPDLAARFFEMFGLLDKIGRWWIVNVDIATDPQFDGEQVDESSIVPGPIMWLQLMMDVALGSEEDSRKHLDEFRKLTHRAKE